MYHKKCDSLLYLEWIVSLLHSFGSWSWLYIRITGELKKKYWCICAPNSHFKSEQWSPVMFYSLPNPFQIHVGNISFQGQPESACWFSQSEFGRVSGGSSLPWVKWLYIQATQGSCFLALCTSPADQCLLHLWTTRNTDLPTYLPHAPASDCSHPRNSEGGSPLLVTDGST